MFAATAEASDRAAWAAFVGTLAFAAACGGGGGATVRLVVGLGVLASALLLWFGMLRRGERAPRGGWWLLPVGAVALAALQLTLPPARDFPGVPRPHATWSRSATLQAAAWWMVVGAAMFAAARMVRSAGRARQLLLALAGAVAFSGLVGMLQRASGNANFLALWSHEDRRRGAVLRDWADDASAWGVGPRAWEPWAGAKLAGADPGASRDKGLWFRPAPARAFFGSYWSAAAWGGLALALAPALLVFAWQYWREAAGLRGGPERVQAWLCLAGAFALTAAGAAAGDALAAPLALLVGLAAALRNARGLRRRRMLPALLLLLALSLLPLILKWRSAELRPLLAARSAAFAAQFQAVRDHLWLGAGIGAGDDALALYAAGSPGAAFPGSGWATTLAESGLPAVALALALGAWLLRRWRRSAAALAPDIRQALGAALAVVAGLAAHALLGAGVESPTPLLLAAVALAAVAAQAAPAVRPALRLAEARP